MVDLNKSSDADSDAFPQNVAKLLDSEATVNDDLATNADDGTADLSRANQALHHRNEELQTLLNVAQIMAGTESYEAKLLQVLEEIAHSVEASRVFLRVPDENGKGLRLTAATGDAVAEFPPIGFIPYRRSASSQAYQKGQIFVVNDYAAYADVTPEVLALGVKSEVALPIKSADRVMAVAVVTSGEVGHFTTERVKLLSAIGDGLGILLENSRLVQDLAASGEEMAVVDEVAQIITSTLDIDQVYERFVSELKKLVKCDRIGVNVIDQINGIQIARYSAGIEIPNAPTGVARPLAGTLTEQLLQTHKTFIRPDLSDSPQYSGIDLRSAELGLRSGIATPLISSGRVVATLSLLSVEANAYGDREQRILERLASQIAPAIENSRLYKDLQASGEEMAVVDEIARIITSTLEIDDVYESFAAEVKKLVDFDRVVIHEIDRDADTSLVRYSLGAGPPTGKAGTVRRLSEIRSHSLVATGEPIIIDDLAAGPTFPLDQEYLNAGLKSAIIVPLVTKGQVSGAFTLRNRHAGAYGDREQRILTRLASQIAPAIENARLYRETRSSQEHHSDIARENQTLAEIGRLISSSLDISEVYPRVAELARKFIRFERMSVSIIDYGHDETISMYSTGIDVQGRRPGDHAKLAGTLAWEVAKTGSSIMLDAEDEEAFTRRFPALIPAFRSGLRSFIAVPLINRDTVIGVLQIRSTELGAYFQSDLEVSEKIGDQIAGAIANSQLYESSVLAQNEERRQVRENQTLAEIGRIISSTPEIDEVFGLFVEQVEKLVSFDRITINRVNPGFETFTNLYTVGEDVPDRDPGGFGPLAGTQLEMVFQTGESHLFQTEDREELAKVFSGLLPNFDAGERSFLSFPLVSEGSVFGALSLRSNTVDAYTEDDVAVMGRIANQIAGAITVSHLYTQVRRSEQEQSRQAKESQTLAEIGRIISSSLDIDEVYARVADQASKIIRFERMSLSTVDYARDQTLSTYTSGIGIPGRQPGEHTPLAGALAGEVARTGASLMFEAELESEVHNRYPQLVPAFRSGLRSFLAVPLINRDVVEGILQIRSTKPGAYSQSDLAIAERIGHQIAGAIANAQLFRQREQMEREMALVDEVARVITSTLDIEQVYDTFAQQMRSVLEFDRVTISVIDSDAHTTTLKYQHGQPVSEREAGMVSPLAGSLTEKVVKTGHTVVRSDVGAFPEFKWDERLLEAGLRSDMVAPLVSESQTIGVISLFCRRTGAYGSREQRILERLAGQIAPAVVNAERAAAEQRRARELTALFDISTILAQPGDPAGKYARVLDELARIVQAYWVTLWRPGEDRRELDLVASSGPTRQDTPSIPLMLGEASLAYESFLEGEPRIINNYPEYPNASANMVALNIYSMAMMPVKAQGRTLGLLNLLSRQRDHFTPQRVDLLTAVVGSLGALLENVRLDEEQRRAESALVESGRLASIGELAAGVAHEINNPLNSVLGYTQLLLEEELPRQAQDDLRNILSEGNRAAGIVQNLLSFARKREPQKEAVDLRDVVQRSLELKSYDFRAANIGVRTQFPRNLPKILADEHQLIEVMLNLLTNAEQAMTSAKSGGEIKIRVATPRKNPEYVRVTITDNGPGIPPDLMDKISDPFFTTKEVGQGTGLGLSMSHGIIGQHNGVLWAESYPGKGASFHIDLPIIMENIGPEASEPDLELFGILGKQVLVVDDEVNARTVMERFLTGEGYEVDLAKDGSEAWRMLQNRIYDCVFLDLRMPDMSGQELYRLIEDSDSEMSGKVVFVTGDTFSEDAHEFIKRTGNPAIMKPINVEELRKHLAIAENKDDDG